MQNLKEKCPAEIRLLSFYSTINFEVELSAY